MTEHDENAQEKNNADSPVLEESAERESSSPAFAPADPTVSYGRHILNWLIGFCSAGVSISVLVLLFYLIELLKASYLHIS